MTAEHVRNLADLSGKTAPERRLPQRARGRLIPQTGDLSPERLRHLYFGQGLSYQRIAEHIGCSHTAIVRALVHAGFLEPPPDRPVKVTRARLVEQRTYTTDHSVAYRRNADFLSASCGAWQSNGAAVPGRALIARASPASLPQPLAPDLYRVLVSANGLDQLRLILALPGMPSLAAAERALGARDLRHSLRRIERVAGFTIIERTRPLTATARGRAFLWRAGDLINNAPAPRA
jgi:hypothetical protein